MYQKYPEGIDQAEGCVSVPTLLKKEDLQEKAHNQLLTRRREMAAQYGFIETKETAMAKQKALYLENKKHSENLEMLELERINADKNYRRDKKLKNEKIHAQFHGKKGVIGNTSSGLHPTATGSDVTAAGGVFSGSSATINVKSLIGCKNGQSVGDKLLAGHPSGGRKGRKGLTFS